MDYELKQLVSTPSHKKFLVTPYTCHSPLFEEDDNVHFQNTAEYAEALVQADKQFDMQVYTNRNHGIYGGNTSVHIFTKITEYFRTHLK